MLTFYNIVTDFPYFDLYNGHMRGILGRILGKNHGIGSYLNFCPSKYCPLCNENKFDVVNRLSSDNNLIYPFGNFINTGNDDLVVHSTNVDDLYFNSLDLLILNNDFCNNTVVECCNFCFI